MKCDRFCNEHCVTSDCPNIQCDMADDKWGFGIAEDMGLERIRCCDCVYQDRHCGCDDCCFRGSSECPESGGASNE